MNETARATFPRKFASLSTMRRHGCFDHACSMRASISRASIADSTPSALRGGADRQRHLAREPAAEDDTSRLGQDLHVFAEVALHDLEHRRLPGAGTTR